MNDAQDLPLDGSDDAAYAVSVTSTDPSGNASTPVAFAFELDTGTAAPTVDLDASTGRKKTAA